MGQGHAGNRCGTEQSPLAAMASSRPPAPVRKGKQRAAAIRPPPSSCPFRGGSMFAGEDERDSRSSPAPPHTKKKTVSLSFRGAQAGLFAHSLGPVRVSFLVPVQCPVRPQRALCCVSPTCTPHRASRCFCFHAITTPAVRPAPRCLARLVPHLGHPSPSPSPVLAQRRNAHSRSLHQCMINLPISSLRCHPPSVPAQLGPVRSWPSASTLSRLLSASSRLASPRIRRVKILSHSKPPPGAVQAPPAEP